MDAIYNINKIHSDLTNNFQEVKIEEKSNAKLGKYFEIVTLNEGLAVKMIVTLKDLESPNIKWSYFSNPLNENSDLVERTSSIYTLSGDVQDVISKKRFSDEYLTEINK